MGTADRRVRRNPHAKANAESDDDRDYTMACATPARTRQSVPSIALVTPVGVEGGRVVGAVILRNTPSVR